MTWFNRKAVIIPAIAIALSIPFVSCNDEDTAHDDSTEAEHNATHGPSHKPTGEYNITPTLNTGNGTNAETHSQTSSSPDSSRTQTQVNESNTTHTSPSH